MSETIRLIVDLLAIAAIGYAILKGVFSAGRETTQLKMQVTLHSKWIADHAECNRKQIEILNKLCHDLAFLRGLHEAQQREP
jgi:hypothetical protein